MKRIKWRAIWLVCWAIFLIADQFFDIRAQLAALIAGSERARPDLFHHRLQTGLLVFFVAVALVPLAGPLVRRLFLTKSPPTAAPVARDARDFSLADALGYLVHRSAWGAGRDAAEEALLREAAALVEEAARKGELEIRGVPTDGAARERISSGYWLSAGIDAAASIDPTESAAQTVPREGEKDGKMPIYRALAVDSRELMKLWPPDNAWRRAGRASTRGVTRGFRVGRRKPGEG